MVNEGTDLIQMVPYEQYLVERDCFNMVRPDWDKVAALGRKWERSTREKFYEQALRVAFTLANLKPLVKQYQAGDESVLGEIEDSLEVMAYSAAKKFSFETHPDTAVFLNLAGEFNKRMFKDEERPEKMYVRIVPFSFSDEDIDEQFPKSVKAALKTFKPEHKNSRGYTTLFSTWFIRRFKADLVSLYKKYKGDAEKIMNREQYEQKGLTWSRNYTAIPDKTNLYVGDFTTDEARWMSLVLESYPYELSVKLRSELLQIDSDTDKNIRDGLTKKLDKRQAMYTENRSKDTYLLPRSSGVLYLSRLARTRPPAEFMLYRGDKLVGEIILDSGLLTVKGFKDPTPAVVARAMDAKTELPERAKLVPAVGNWYKVKGGLKLLPGVSGKYNDSVFYRDKHPEPAEPKPFFVYHHVVKPTSESLKLRWPSRVTAFPYRQKIYCKNEPTMGSLMLYRKELCRQTAQRIKERERRKASADWYRIMAINVIFRFFFE